MPSPQGVKKSTGKLASLFPKEFTSGSHNLFNPLPCPGYPRKTHHFTRIQINNASWRHCRVLFQNPGPWMLLQCLARNGPDSILTPGETVGHPSTRLQGHWAWNVQRMHRGFQSQTGKWGKGAGVDSRGHDPTLCQAPGLKDQSR